MHNEHKVLSKYIQKLNSGENLALISDAGMPSISDPGFLLVRECVKESIDIECLPGATAFLPALVNSGIPTDKFSFEGFLPFKKGRAKRLEFLKIEYRTMIFYESPHRIIKTLNDFSVCFGPDRSISVSREISKMYEETIRGSVFELILHFKNKKPKGEFVIVVEGKK